jgi:hypothetical protein
VWVRISQESLLRATLQAGNDSNLFGYFLLRTSLCVSIVDVKLASIWSYINLSATEFFLNFGTLCI